MMWAGSVVMALEGMLFLYTSWLPEIASEADVLLV